MPLQVVPLQLKLFPNTTGQFVCGEVGGRTGDQWLRSVLAYLSFRAGESWRRSTDRFNPERREYLLAARLVLAVRNAPVKSNETALEVGRPNRVPVHSETDSRGRAQLVDELMRANPALTSRKLLSGLTKAKLLRMLEDARARLERTA